MTNRGNIFFCAFVLLSCCLLGQNNDTINSTFMEPKTESILSLKPDEGIKTTVTIANLVETNVYEAPSIISVVTDADIERMGYTDLLDVLNNIPGISIATDIQNATSIAIRGNWAEEGKVLFMIDGLIMNDMGYGAAIIGHRFPLANVSRIEIIRGPGSAIYGGLAALGAINIITKKGQQLNGSYLAVGAGTSNKKISKAMINYTYGGYLLKGIELSVTGLVNVGKRNTDMIQLPDSCFVNYNDSSAVNDAHVQIALKYNNFKFKGVFEDYNFQATYEPIYSLARTYVSEISNQFLLFKKLKFIPYVSYKWQLPWNTQYGPPAIYDVQNLVTQNYNIGYYGDLPVFNWLKFNFGGQYYNNKMRFFRNAMLLNNGTYSRNLEGANGYIETQFITKITNITLAGRYEQYSYFTPRLLPRFALTKSFKLWHYKLLYGESYKLPTLQNINLNAAQTINPEDVVDYQAEIGYDGKLFSASLAGFNTTISRMILFSYDLNNFTESYINSKGTINSRGLEFETKLKLKQWDIGVNFSNYNVVKNTIKEITVDTLNVAKGNLAFPKHKVVAMIHYKINTMFSVGVNYVYQAEKYSNTRINSISNEYVVLKYPSSHIVNVVAQAKGFFSKIMDVNFGVNNILNTKNHYLYPYSSGYFGTLGIGRELFVQLKFNL